MRCYCLYIYVLLLGCQQSADKKNSYSLPGIDWMQHTLKQIGKADITEQPYFSYPRTIQLSDSDLIIVFEHNGNIYSSKSKDLGESWTDKQLIAEKRNNIYITVPDITELSNGELLITYNLRPQKINNSYDTSQKFSIAVKRSSDKGDSWSAEKIVYEGGYSFENGCWEPAIVQLPGDRLYLFFSNETIYTDSDEQNISVLASVDFGKSWNSVPEIISFAKGFRDGMPVPVLNSNKQLLFSIEDNSDGGEFKPSIITVNLPWTGAVIDENNVARKKVLRGIFAKNIYAGAPFIRQLNTGEFLLSVQTTYQRHQKWNLSTCKMVIFDNHFEQHKIVKDPFKIPHNKFALWNSFTILKDNKTVIAFTATNAFNNYNAIWMIKGEIKNK